MTEARVRVGARTEPGRALLGCRPCRSGGRVKGTCVVCHTYMGTVPDALQPLVVNTRDGADRRASVAKRRKVRLREGNCQVAEPSDPEMTTPAVSLMSGSMGPHPLHPTQRVGRQSKFHRTTSECRQKTSGTQKSSPLSLKGGRKKYKISRGSQGLRSPLESRRGSLGAP